MNDTVPLQQGAEAPVRDSARVQELTHNVHAVTDQREQTRAQKQLQEHANHGARSVRLSRFAGTLQGGAGVMQRRTMQAMADRRTAARAGDGMSGTAMSAQTVPNPTGLPDQLKDGIEHLSGLRMDHVRVHYNSSEPARLGALAYAQGAVIHVGPGQEHHLPHEAWHLVQQAQGRVRPTVQMKEGVAINDDCGLEREADDMGMRALVAVAAQAKATGAAGRGGPASVPRPASPIQRKIKISKKDVPSETVRDVIASIRQYLRTKSLLFVRKGDRKHGLFKAIDKKAYEGRKAAILDIIEKWLGDEVEDRDFRNWTEVVNLASVHHATQEAAKQRTPEAQERLKRSFAEMMGNDDRDGEELIEDSAPGTEAEQHQANKLPLLRRRASLTTDLFNTGDFEDERILLAIRRRKKHKSGTGDLPGYAIRYRSYSGTISPKANAFVLGGSLATDYKPLMKELVDYISTEIGELDGDESVGAIDKYVARLFLREMAGHDAFSAFSPDARERAHKVIAVILFAELSRHSIALVSAAAAFHAVASRKDEADQPGLVESFATGSGEERPLFAGTNGAEIMRSESTALSDVTARTVITRRARGVVDLLNFLAANRAVKEELGDVLSRKTLEYLFAMAPHTGEDKLTMSTVAGGLHRFLARVQMGKKDTTDPLVTLAELGFSYRAQDGDENNCAIFSLYDQLTVRHGIPIPNRAGFVEHVRARVGGATGTMIDLVAQGQALIDAARDYMNTLGLPQVDLSLTVWARTGGSTLMEFNDVASSGANALRCVFYFNGVNHFDSLGGGAL